MRAAHTSDPTGYMKGADIALTGNKFFALSQLGLRDKLEKWIDPCAATFQRRAEYAANICGVRRGSRLDSAFIENQLALVRIKAASVS
jgi:hypothetical protein